MLRARLARQCQSPSSIVNRHQWLSMLARLGVVSLVVAVPGLWHGDMASRTTPVLVWLQELEGAQPNRRHLVEEVHHGALHHLAGG